MNNDLQCILDMKDVYRFGKSTCKQVLFYCDNLTIVLLFHLYL